jgi:CO/xanthine dehydrogenase Mo-binding subunit
LCFQNKPTKFHNNNSIIQKMNTLSTPKLQKIAFLVSVAVLSFANTPMAMAQAKDSVDLGTIGATPCVVNAVADALARNGHAPKCATLQMPLTPFRLWEFLQAA